MKCVIRVVSEASEAEHFAAGELARFLVRATGAEWRVAAPGEGGLCLGCYSALPSQLPDDVAADADNDDIVIGTSATGGVIAGSNPRAVVYAAYRFLTELGFRWVRPGADGELIPQLSLPLPEISCRETASYRHRGICIEGAVSEQNVLDVVDWMPKIGFNAYFIQFREAYNFYQRWYEHTGNPELPREPFTTEDARRLTRRLRHEIKSRGLDLHMVGHGWTCEPFGIPGPGWFQHEGEIPEHARVHLAQIDGQRELWGGIALNTSLCYGNPTTREIVTDAIVEWAHENPDVDIIHFWLADGSNNNCECDLCAHERPADLYVRMLNELDVKLRARQLDVRIVFLVYVDLLWPPEHDVLHDPTRFILMFAPITRSYSTPFAPEDASERELPDYVRNRLKFPKDPAVNIAFLRAWQQMFAGDGFDFDYHFMWDHHRDPGQFAMAKVLHSDIQRLESIGLNGFMSCQNQRVFFPTGLGMTVMGRTLWNRDLTFAEIAEDYFRSAFGEDWEQACRYAETVSELFNPPLLRGEGLEEQRQETRRRLAEVPVLVAEMGPAMAAGSRLTEACHAASWRYLKSHSELCLLLADAVRAVFAGDAENARALGWDVCLWARRHEVELQPVFDVFEFQHTWGPFFGISRDELT